MNTSYEHFFEIKDEATFEKLALEVFNHQAINCNVYREFIGHLGIKTKEIKSYLQIPFLPISFFKSHRILSQTTIPEKVFSSSGTTGQTTSQHFVSDLQVYEKSFNIAFEQFYGPIKDTCLLALLPSYLEREGSSLIYMVDSLLKQSEHEHSGYFLHNLAELAEKLKLLKAKGQKTILIGVTYALLDFIERHKIDFPELIVMETGGMKGKRKEMVREELHELLCDGFGVSKIHSEYGMTELLSQAYSLGDGIFECPPWMKILLRDTYDPLMLLTQKQTGGINLIDLANVNSCSFIATQDLGKLFSDGKFEVLGRFDNADVRGCNLLVQ
ncbi:MAG: acyl transferase [Pedobacter sp.]|nr:MAG: acyl transferase [Pedobacter sp.]